MRIFLPFILFLSLIGCDYTPTPYRSLDVDRVFYHEWGAYTVFLVRDKKVIEIRLVLPEVRIDAENNSYIEGNIEYNENRTYVTHGILHLKSLKEINGAGWNHGKHGHGQTVEVE